MTEEVVVENQTVLVEGTRIIQIGPSHEVAIPENTAAIDGAGAYLMPGLADMHIHSTDNWLSDTAWPASPLDLFLANGVTTIRDCGHNGDINLPLRWREEIQAGYLDGPTIYTTGSVLYDDHRGPVYPGIVQDQVDQGFDFLKLYSPLSEEHFYEAMAEAKQLGLYTVGHIPYQVGLDGALAAGMNEIAHVEEVYFASLDLELTGHPSEEEWLSQVIEVSIPLLEATGDNPEAIEKLHGEAISTIVNKLRSADVVVGTTMVVGEVIVQKLFEPEVFLARPENRYLPLRNREQIRRGEDEHQLIFRGIEDLAPGKYATDQLILAHLRQAGIPLILGTDASPTLAVVPGFSIHDELRILTENGYSLYEAIATATVNAAQVIEATAGSRDCGTIEVGNRADLILVAGNPLEDLVHIREPLGVMAAGRWYSRETLERMIAIED
jgi:imidazolonepropionase-like amidohydrolase